MHEAIHPQRSRSRLLIAATAVAAAAAVATAAIVARESSNLKPSADTRTTLTTRHQTDSSAPVVLADIRRIVDTSNAALGRSARATVRITEGTNRSAATVAHVSLSGDDSEMVIDVPGSDGRPGFTAHNKTVDGEFYLLDGPPGAQRWTHDVNEPGKDLSTVDPRRLLALLSRAGSFAVVGTATIDGVTVRHLRVTSPSSLPELDLGLGPIDGKTVTALDLWVDGNDVTHRIDIATAETQDVFDEGVFEKLPDGVIVVRTVDGKVIRIAKGQTITPEIKAQLGHTTIELRSTYSATFSDIGAPITISAPTDAVDIAGKG